MDEANRSDSGLRALCAIASLLLNEQGDADEKSIDVSHEVLLPVPVAAQPASASAGTSEPIAAAVSSVLQPGLLKGVQSSPSFVYTTSAVPKRARVESVAALTDRESEAQPEPASISDSDSERKARELRDAVREAWLDRAAAIVRGDSDAVAPLPLRNHEWDTFAGIMKIPVCGFKFDRHGCMPGLAAGRSAAVNESAFDSHSLSGSEHASGSDSGSDLDSTSAAAWSDGASESATTRSDGAALTGTSSLTGSTRAVTVMPASESDSASVSASESESSSPSLSPRRGSLRAGLVASESAGVQMAIRVGVKRSWRAIMALEAEAACESVSPSDASDSDSE